MIRRPPRSTLSSSSAASDVYKRQVSTQSTGDKHPRMATVALRIPPSGVSEPQEAAGELTCISALLSLSLPKCPRSRDACAPLEHDRPHKAHKCSHNNSTAAPVTPRGTTQPSLDPGIALLGRVTWQVLGCGSTSGCGCSEASTRAGGP
eukprot:TRINITY_DN1220_c0_g1_i3.p1 TRINITY_DN1220_c0_g1~~TRINITY_DN1220_c0_g1_i3.p1  ORF type:complete len:149 (-),score=11.23 TRINITY_DN1220_c0_g1_i3:453-899(-)